MKRLLILIFAVLGLSAFTQPRTNIEKYKLPTTPVNQGEFLEFRLSYGWFTVGKANINIADRLKKINQEECYRIDIKGKTAGLLGAFSKVNDEWGAYVSKDELLPYVAWSDLQEGKYQRKEHIIFDQSQGTITVDMTKRNKKRPVKTYEVDGDIHDLMSGFMNMRSINYRSLSRGDTVRFNVFYDEEFYDFGFVYEGKELVDTQVGELYGYKVFPILPPNKIFPGKNPITAWVSADASQLPLKVRADMFFGTAYVELINYKNIKYGPDFQE